MAKPPEHWRPFNKSRAIVGDPFGTMSGTPIRLLTWDKKIEGGEQAIFLVYREERKDEIILTLNRDDGIIEGYCGETLVMLPIFYLYGKPVFPGDRLIRNRGAIGEYSVLANPGMVDWSNLSWPKVKKEVWQARMKFFDGSKEYIEQELFDSKELCDAHHIYLASQQRLTKKPEEFDTYVRAELICTYEV